MADEELLQKIEDSIVGAIKSNENNKTKWLSLETIIKLGFALIMGAFAYAGVINTLNNVVANVSKIEQAQVKQSDKDDLKLQTMELQIQTCSTELAIIKQQLIDLKSKGK